MAERREGGGRREGGYAFYVRNGFTDRRSLLLIVSN